jgi:hypothetical protein
VRASLPAATGARGSHDAFSIAQEITGLAAGTMAAAFPESFDESMAAAAGADDGRAELIVVNANVDTVDDRTPQCEAFAVRTADSSRWARTRTSRRSAAPATPKIDAERMTIHRLPTTTLRLQRTAHVVLNQDDLAVAIRFLGEIEKLLRRPPPKAHSLLAGGWRHGSSPGSKYLGREALGFLLRLLPRQFLDVQPGNPKLTISHMERAPRWSLPGRHANLPVQAQVAQVDSAFHSLLPPPRFGAWSARHPTKADLLRGQPLVEFFA